MRDLSIAFRTDASTDIGTGHVMRCLTLADALREIGARAVFLCRDHPGNLLGAIEQRGHVARALPLPGNDTGAAPRQHEPLRGYDAWLGASWEEDADQVLAALGRAPVDWLVVDHYALDARWERRMGSACKRLMVIDDLADRPHDCALLLDQNLGRLADDYRRLVPFDCRVLASPRFALLRPDFAALRGYSLARRRPRTPGHLLITMGGVDKDNATGGALAALRSCTLPRGCRITVVMGRHAPWLQKVRQQAADLPWPTEVRSDVRDMARVMADCDLAIGAAGSTSWERCCLGVPAVLVVLADNQVAAARALAETGAVRMTTLTSLAEDLREFLAHCATAPSTLVDMSAAAAAVTQGDGAPLVRQALIDGAAP